MDNDLQPGMENMSPGLRRLGKLILAGAGIAAGILLLAKLSERFGQSVASAQATRESFKRTFKVDFSASNDALDKLYKQAEAQRKQWEATFDDTWDEAIGKVNSATDKMKSASSNSANPKAKKQIEEILKHAKGNSPERLAAIKALLSTRTCAPKTIIKMVNNPAVNWKLMQEISNCENNSALLAVHITGNFQVGSVERIRDVSKQLDKFSKAMSVISDYILDLDEDKVKWPDVVRQHKELFKACWIVVDQDGPSPDLSYQKDLVKMSKDDYIRRFKNKELFEVDTTNHVSKTITDIEMAHLGKITRGLEDYGKQEITSADQKKIIDLAGYVLAISKTLTQDVEGLVKTQGNLMEIARHLGDERI